VGGRQGAQFDLLLLYLSYFFYFRRYYQVIVENTPLGPSSKFLVLKSLTWSGAFLCIYFAFFLFLFTQNHLLLIGEEGGMRGSDTLASFPCVFFASRHFDCFSHFFSLNFLCDPKSFFLCLSACLGECVERVCARDIDCMSLKTGVWGEKVGPLHVFVGGKEKKI
jgi:hypothetical protein